MIRSVFGVLLAISSIFFIFAYLRTIFQYIRKVRVVRKLEISHDSPSIHLVEEFKQAPGPLPWPLLGNLNLLGRYATPFQAFTDLAKQFGDIYTLTLGSTRCLIVNNLDLIREVLNKNGKHFGGRPDFIRFHVLFGGNRNNSLALCDWSRLQEKRRNLARKYCSPRDMSSLFQKMSDIGCFEIKRLLQELQQVISTNNEISIKKLINQACANMFSNYMCSICFDYDDKEFQGMVHSFDEIFWEINQGYIIDFLPWLKPFYADHLSKIVNWSATIRKFIVERIIYAREKTINIDEPEKDFTDALLNSLVDSEDNEVSRETIIYMLEDFIGGHSAVGNLVTVALAYIIRYPEIGKRIRKEVDSVIQDNSVDNVTLMDLDRLPYTVATIYEVLRYSSSPIVPHVATEDVIVAGYGVTKGTIVFVNNYELNTNTKYWERPNEFNPSRFFDNTSNERKIKKNIPHFLPFSIGKRTCVGQNLVRGFSFLLLANILHKYEISTNNIKSIKTHPACIALTPDPFLVTLEARK